jgi:hypothetical protein
MMTAIGASSPPPHKLLTNTCLLGWVDASRLPNRDSHAAQWCGGPIGVDRLALTRAPALLAGAFVVAFDDERAAQAAARECRSTAFVADVTEGVHGGWQLHLRRKGLFPADERDRYASRVRRIVVPHGGRYETFLPDVQELNAGARHERTTT